MLDKFQKNEGKKEGRNKWINEQMDKLTNEPIWLKILKCQLSWNSPKIWYNSNKNASMIFF